MPIQLQCPACQRILKHRKVDGVTLDVCQGGCGGIWFDNRELQKFDNANEDGGRALLDVAVDAGLRIDHRRKRACPRCEDVKMKRRFYSPKRRVELDECGGCGGIWLDLGELESVRAEFASDAEQQTAIRDFVQEAGRLHLKKIRTESPQGRKQARRFSNLFGFLGVHR